MTKIETFVTIDLETTGLPHKEYNRTKITEMCLLATSRKDIRNTKFGELPPMSKLSFMLNPEKEISPDSARITGITDQLVKNSPTFKEKFNTLNAFLKDLKKPVCLVAHNGNTFDYRILLAECADANVLLPGELLCVDSLSIFRKISPKQAVKSTSAPEKPPRLSQQNKSVDTVDKSMNNTLLSAIMTDDEDDWPELNLTPVEIKEIDDLSLSGLSLQSTPQNRNKKQRESFKLTDIYIKFFGEFDGTAHRAEDDCLMLLKCIVAEQTDFLKYSDNDCKLLCDCKPLERKVKSFNRI